MLCGVPYCIARPDLELGCGARTFPVPYCIVLPCPASLCPMPALPRCCWLCCVVLLGYAAWARSWVTLPGPILHLDLPCTALCCLPWKHTAPAPCCSVPCCCSALPAAAPALCAWGCLLSACVMPSCLVPWCLPCLTLPSPAHEFLIPGRVRLPGLLPAASPPPHPHHMPSCTLWPFPLLAHSSFLCGAGPSQGLSPLCLIPSVLPLSRHEPQRPGAVQCLGARSCPGWWQPMGLSRVVAQAGGGMLREGTCRWGSPQGGSVDR